MMIEPAVGVRIAEQAVHCARLARLGPSGDHAVGLGRIGDPLRAFFDRAKHPVGRLAGGGRQGNLSRSDAQAK